MKKSIYAFGILLFIGLSSCAIEKARAVGEEIVEDEAKAEPTLVGDWRLADFDMGIEIPEGQLEMFYEIKEEMIANSTMTYKADGTYSQNDMMDGGILTQTGTYSIDGNKLTTISSTSGDGVETVTDITKLTQTEVIFSLTDQGNTMTMTYTRK